MSIDQSQRLLILAHKSIGIVLGFSKQRTTQIALLCTFVVVFGTAVFLSQTLAQNPAAQAIIAQLGYIGVFLSAVVAGLNPFIPIPAATLSPAFLNAGLQTLLIIVTLAVGTLCADMLSYLFGKASRTSFPDAFPKTFAFFTKLQERYALWVIPAVIVYAAIVPFPNEAILIPLAFGSYPLKKLLLPLLLGNLIHQSILVYGFQNLFLFLF